jgi:hypothetical protein
MAEWVILPRIGDPPKTGRHDKNHQHSLAISSLIQPSIRIIEIIEII